MTSHRAPIIAHPSAPAPLVIDERERLIWLLGELRDTIENAAPSNPARMGAIRQYDELAARLSVIDESRAADLDDEAAYQQWVDELPRMPARWVEAAVVHYCDVHGLELKPRK
tara:strand:- start:401 stop:739 length:339 start_codon:yes stop_codon:yes gene_type:complete